MNKYTTYKNHTLRIEMTGGGRWQVAWYTDPGDISSSSLAFEHYFEAERYGKRQIDRSLNGEQE